MSIKDKDFLPWNSLSRENMLSELEAQNDFVSPNDVQESPLNLKEHPQKNNLRNRVLQSKKFIPGIVFYPKNVTSALTRREQAKCLNALKLFQSGVAANTLTKSQQEDVEVYKSLHMKIQEEHAKFLDYVRKDWQNSLSRLEDIKIVLFKYALNLWKIKLQKTLSYSRFYKFVNSVRLAHEDPDHLTKVAIDLNVLNFSSQSVFTCPTLVSKCLLKLSKLPAFGGEFTYNSKLSVSQDANVDDILQTHPVDIVISMSGIKRLMDDSDANSCWNVPLIIKEYEYNGKKIVYIDKALPLQSPTKPDFKEQCYKRLLKTNFCIAIEEGEQKLDKTIPNPHPFSSDISDNDLKSLGLDFHLAAPNVVYSIWNISRNSDENVLLKTRTDDKNIRFLLRQKIDTYEHLPDGNKRPVVLAPKIEHQLEHGASICTKRELVRQWTDLFFRPFSHLYRVRILGSTSEVIDVESVSLQKINMEAVQHYQYKPHERLGALFTIFSQITKLECGNYLLHHNERTGAFAEILKETSEGEGLVKFDLVKEYNPEYCNVKTARNRPWCPIDVNYITHAHNAFKRMPGMFKPAQYLTVERKKEKKNRAKKAKRIKKQMAQKTT